MDGAIFGMLLYPIIGICKEMGIYYLCIVIEGYSRKDIKEIFIKIFHMASNR